MNHTVITILLVASAIITYLIMRYREGDPPPFMETIKTTVTMLWNKGAAVLFLVFLMYRYTMLDNENPTPFAELLYAAILGSAIIVLAPFLRLLVFPEAAEYAESGKLRSSIQNPGAYVDNALKHYWFATAISYAVTALCVSSLL